MCCLPDVCSACSPEQASRCQAMVYQYPDSWSPLKRLVQYSTVLDSNQDWCWNPVKLPPWCPKPHKHKLRYCNIDILDSKGTVSTSWDIFLCYLNLTFFLACQPHLVVVVLVSVKISLQGKYFLAALLLTLEWLLTSVSHHVSLQRTLLSESAGTSMLGAFKRLFSTVNP